MVRRSGQRRINDAHVNTIRGELSTGRLRNPFCLLADKVSTARLVEIDLAKKEQVRVALVSLPKLLNEGSKGRDWKLSSHSVVGKPRQFGVDYEACTRSLVELSPALSQRLECWYSEALVFSLEKLEADIVCFNELAFPSFRQQPRKSALKISRRLAERHRSLIVAGSSHDRRTLYNTGRLFFPGCGESGQPFHKQVSALSTGERISIPSARETRYARVFGLRIAVMICLDIADFATVASVVKLADRVDLLLVPCYTRWFEKLQKMALAASQAMPGMVALANYRHPEVMSCTMARFGETVPPDMQEELLDSGTMIKIFDIDPVEFEVERLRRENGPSNLEWLFGPKNIPVLRT